MSRVPGPIHSGSDAVGRVRDLLAAKPDGILEQVAREAGAAVVDVLRALPPGQCLFVGPERFTQVWEALTGWGTVLLIVHTPDIVLECKGALPPGSHGAGFWNFHGDSPIGGHLRAAHCAAIAFVDRPFHGRRSCSVQVFNAAGEAIVKVFVARSGNRELDPDQLAAFEATRARFASGASAAD